ncbi:MAG: RNA-binding S4 domain-containing protein [Deltaproteobacteria bacterium]
MSEKTIVPKDKDIRVLRVKSLPIELYMILKIENLVQSGGEAKVAISEGLVQVNREVETRKRKKIFSGDIVSFADVQVQVFAEEKDR